MRTDNVVKLTCGSTRSIMLGVVPLDGLSAKKSNQRVGVRANSKSLTKPGQGNMRGVRGRILVPCESSGLHLRQSTCKDWFRVARSRRRNSHHPSNSEWFSTLTSHSAQSHSRNVEQRSQCGCPLLLRANCCGLPIPTCPPVPMRSHKTEECAAVIHTLLVGPHDWHGTMKGQRSKIFVRHTLVSKWPRVLRMIMRPSPPTD